MIGSVNDLEILTHCYAGVGPIPRADAPAVAEGIDRLYLAGLIDRGDGFSRITDCGRFYLDHLLHTPFPEATFFIPERGATE